MSLNRRLLVAVSLVVVICFAGCPASAPPGTAGTNPPQKTSGKKRLIFLTNGDHPFWDTCNAGLMEGAKEFDVASKGYTVVMDKGNFQADGQIDKLRQYATEEDVAAVAISVVQADNKAIIDEMNKLKKMGKKIITVDGDVNREKFRDARTYYIGTDNAYAGGVLGTALKTLLEARDMKSGGYCQFAGFTDNDNARSRMDGVQKAMGEAYKELDRKPDQGDPNIARDNTRTALDNHGDKINALVGIWAYDGPAIADVVSERKLQDKIVVGTFDAAVDAIQKMQEGKIDVLCVQNPFDMGRQSVKLMQAMCEGDEAVTKEMFPNAGEPEGDVFKTGLRVVVPSEKSPLTAEKFDTKIVEFMTLEQFQLWLKKYKLTCS